MCFPKGPWHGGEQKTKHSFQKKHVYDGRPLSLYIVMPLSNYILIILFTCWIKVSNGVKPPNCVTSLWTGGPIKVHLDLNLSLFMQHTHTHLGWAGLITYPFAMFRRPKDLDFKRITESHRVEERGLVKKCEANVFWNLEPVSLLLGWTNPFKRRTFLTGVIWVLGICIYIPYHPLTACKLIIISYICKVVLWHKSRKYWLLAVLCL